MKLNVGVIYGGRSNECDISVNTGMEIINNLDSSKYNIVKIFIPYELDNKWVYDILNNKLDIVVIGLHGGIGENGSIQGLLECLNIPYIGSDVLGSAIGMNKYITKKLLESNNIKIPKYLFIKNSDKIDKKNYSKLDYPLVIKPNEEGSSVGVMIVNNTRELMRGLKKLKRLGYDILVEEYISGNEISCGVIEDGNDIEVLDVLDIKPNSIFYDYKAKYDDDKTYIDISSLSEDIVSRIKDIAKEVFITLNSKDYARVDMIVSDNDIYVLEINTLPGMTGHSLIPKELKLKNISYGEFLDRLITNRLRK